MEKITGIACDFLEGLQRPDLAILLRHCQAAMIATETYNGFFNELIDEAIIEAPKPIDEALVKLPPQDRKRVAEALASAYPNTKTPDDISVRSTNVVAGGIVALLAEMVIQRDTMIDVATGGARIQEVDDYYRAREVRIRQTIPDRIKYENPHVDLWDWYRHWSAELPQYKDRRSYIRELFGPAISAIASQSSLPSEPREPTGWERVDRTLSKIRTQIETASAEEDCQAIGLLCREIIISLAQAVYDPQLHAPLDGVRPSETDANRMLEGYIAHKFPGASNKEVRAHARASLALALNLQHRRTATRQLAALCVEATASTTAVISIIARTNAV
ncbi:hypothetical protein [Maricaulis sp.]|uniref:hypothetical protein n=1 Tax=Maricaulis sp. TaxID=1486257 RepID=UPI003A8D616E